MPVRAVAYYRRDVGDPVETRVTHQLHDAAGRLSEQRDPRLFALMPSGAAVPPNLSTFYSLSGQSLCSHSVDAGWQLSLSGAAGQALEAWDQRGWHRQTEHDSLLRPVAIFEHFPDEPARCAERITWGSSSPDDAPHNRCGQPVRHDDPAGSRLLPEYGLSGVVLAEVRRFLDSLDPPDWPLAETERNSLLEPGDGARAAWHFAATCEALSQTDAKGHVRHFAHDRAGQLREVGLQRAGQPAAETLVSAIEYSALGQIQHELAGNGMRTVSSYDPADGHLLSLANQGPDGVFLQNLSYRYDPAGNITEITDAALPIQYFDNQRIEPVRRFTYDTLYQLIKATGWETAKPSFGPALSEWQAFGPPDASRWSNYSETYHYDEAGNLLERTHLGAENDTLTMQVAAHSNRSVKDRPGADLEALFDARGNLLELQPGQALQWNGRNELAQVTQVTRIVAANDWERYVYDAEGMRLRKWRSAAAKSVIHTAEVRYLPGIEVHVNTASGEQLQVISVKAGRCSVRLLYWDGPPPDGVVNDQLRYCFDDHLGSSAFEVDAQAKPISHEVYYPFGGTAWLAGRHVVETSYKTIRYSGKERDATGLYYYGARYYAPWLQRWLNSDPAGALDGLNFYRFVRNNPMNFVDKEGYLPVLRYYFDFAFESSSGIRDLIQQRGVENIRKVSPDLAERLTDAIQVGKNDVERTISDFGNRVFDSERFEQYFGSNVDNEIGEVKNRFLKILKRFEKIENKPDKIVLFADQNGKYKHTMAMIGGADRRNKVYVNFVHRDIRNLSDVVFTLKHELSHQDDSETRTMDYWYLEPSDDDFAKATFQHGVQDPEESKHFARLIQSERIVKGGVLERDIPIEIQEGFIKAAGGENLSEALKVFNRTPELRYKMARRNADTIAAYGSFHN
ncbi:RHS repeat-associated core domain-containing protein [Pseudomonas sp. SJZ080]|uniref:RHS repeat-associated core domain-containing protein n=1 Tax=Pseudomonas sp. SJZ080 TaxID=2572888 RepID=UPI002113F60F|nr:RHS repeat-associated core domain-containing protein [Pseudomonas sp. SJZ080]